jgi:hypothetical protein
MININISWGSAWGYDGFFYIRSGKEDYDFEEEIAAFCPNDAFDEGSGVKGKDREYAIYDWVLNNGTRIETWDMDETEWYIDGDIIYDDDDEDGFLNINRNITFKSLIYIFTSLFVSIVLTGTL